MDVKQTTLAMQVVLRQGGLQPGGLNFDAKLRRESSDLEDLFIGHIAGMDTFARGLLAAARLEEEGTFQAWRDERYASWKGELGQKIVSGQVTFAELEQFALQAG